MECRGTKSLTFHQQHNRALEDIPIQMVDKSFDDQALRLVLHRLATILENLGHVLDGSVFSLVTSIYVLHRK
jgi:hypothetical protein